MKVLAKSVDATAAINVFDDIPRSDNGSPDQDETAFAYLNRSGRAEAARVRQLVNAWFAHYPATHRHALVARFRSTIDDQHKSAFFELFVHEFILVRGHKILAIEPRLSHSSKSPDFLVQTNPGHHHRFYIECVIATGRSQEETAAQARLNQALSAVDNTPSTAHFLDLSVHGTPNAPVSINRLRRMLREWIAGLREGDGAKQAAPFVYDEYGMRITLRPFPRFNRERPSRAIGVRHFPVQQVKPDRDIRAALEKKASPYGTLDHPYLVAVNAFGFFQREDAALDALLGIPAVVFRSAADREMETEEIRKPDGIWIGPRGPRKRGLSAVLSTEQIDPWNFASRRARLIRNPCAAAVLSPFFGGIDEFELRGDGFRLIEGARIGSIFGLPQGWPEE